MANQTAIINLSRSPLDAKGQGKNNRGLRVTLVDTDATASTFTDLGAAVFWVADMDYWVQDINGRGTTAPATALSFQFNMNGNDIGAFINGASVYDPTSTPEQRLPGAWGKRIPQGTTVRIIGRA